MSNLRTSVSVVVLVLLAGVGAAQAEDQGESGDLPLLSDLIPDGELCSLLWPLLANVEVREFNDDGEIVWTTPYKEVDPASSTCDVLQIQRWSKVIEFEGVFEAHEFVGNAHQFGDRITMDVNWVEPGMRSSRMIYAVEARTDDADTGGRDGQEAASTGSAGPADVGTDTALQPAYTRHPGHDIKPIVSLTCKCDDSGSGCDDDNNNDCYEINSCPTPPGNCAYGL